MLHLSLFKHAPVYYQGTKKWPNGLKIFTFIYNA